ncbi:MAG TPA: hypothetical protein VIL18_00315 [Longimicrobiales bacterium]
MRRLCWLAVLAACGGAGAPNPTVRTDSAGVEIVVGPARDRMLPWHIERERVLGGAPDGPESFYLVRPGLVEADDDGNLYILDRTNARVVSFDSAGRLRWTAGRQGGGPGELQDANTLSLGPDGVVHVHDLTKAALVRFGPDGTVLPQVAFPFPPILVGEAIMHVLADGLAVIDRARYSGSDERPVRLLHIAGADTTVLFTRVLPLSRTAHYPSCGMTLTLPTPFAPRIRWTRRGSRIAITTGAAYGVEIYESGRLVRSVRRPIEPRQITAADVLAVLRERAVGGPIAPCNVSAAEMIEKHGYAPELQIVYAVALAPDGSLWVRRSAGLDGSAGPIDVFDASGEYTGSLPPETPFPLVFLPGDRIGFAERDEVDVERLVIARVVRP